MAKFPYDPLQVDLLIESALRSFAAGAKIMTLPPEQEIDEGLIPDVPGRTPGLTAVMQIWSNPGECVYAVSHLTGRSVNFQTLMYLAQAAMAKWKESAGGHDTPGVGSMTPDEWRQWREGRRDVQRDTNPNELSTEVGGGITIYKRECGDVPKGYFRISVERLEREYGPF